MSNAEAVRQVEAAGFVVGVAYRFAGKVGCRLCNGSGSGSSEDGVLFAPACTVCGGHGEVAAVSAAYRPLTGVELARFCGAGDRLPVRVGADRWLWHGCTIERFVTPNHREPTISWLVVDLDSDDETTNSYVAASRRGALAAVVYRRGLLPLGDS